MLRPPPADPAAFLASHAPFAALSAEELAGAVEALEMRYAEAGDVLLASGGSPSDALWVVRHGEVRLESEGSLLEVLREGECFGFPSLLGGRPPRRDAIASRPSLLLRLPERAFRRLLDRAPAVAGFFLEGLASRLRHEGGLGGVARPLAGGRPPVAQPATAPAAGAARVMRDRGVGSLLVTCGTVADGVPIHRSRILGIVTDRDLRDRVLAPGRSADTALAEIATRDVVTLPRAATDTDALLAFARHGVRHLPLTDGDQVVGFVSGGDLVSERSLHPLAVRRDVERLPLDSLLVGWTDRLRRVVGELHAAGVDATRVGQLTASLGDALAKRLLERARRDRAAEGVVQVGWFVHGSEGREEQLLPTDQDNALAFLPAPGADPDEARRTAREIATSMVDGLLRAGYPECPGGYMASRWCDPVSTWVERFAAWADNAAEGDRVDFTTFLDLRRVAGDLDVTPLDRAHRAAGASARLRRALAADAAAWPLPLGFFGDLREGEEGFDLKRGSLLLVAVARLAALEAGSTARGTLARLADAAVVLGEDAPTLAEAFSYLASLRLAMAVDPARGAAKGSGHRVRLDSLNALERRFLKDIFGLLRSLQKGLRAKHAL